MALAHKFLLTPMTIGLRAASLAAFLPVLVYSAHLCADEAAQELRKEFEDSEHLDWVPFEQLTDAQKLTVPNSCCKGAYVAPTRTDSDVSLQPKNAPFRSHADEEISERQSLLQFNGKVAITQGNRSISTESALYDKETGQAKLTGGIQLRDPNVMISADSGDINIETGDASFNNTRFVFYESRIHGVAENLQKFGDNVINLEQSLISSCEPGDNAWSIRGSEISLHPDENYGTAKNMRINIQDIPVFYLPYVRFPVGNERLTGFLIPTPGYTKRNGAELAVPFYWNIAPNADATFTSHYLSNRGFMLETEVRHLSSYFETELKSSVINNDKGGFSSYLESQIASGMLTEEKAYPYRGHDRWYAKLEQAGGMGQEWSTSINYADLSDKDYLRDMYNSSSADSNRQAFIRQTASADYRSDHWFSGIRVDEYRLLTTSQLPYRELPRIHVNGNYQIDDWVLKLNNEYVNFVQNRYFAGSFSKPEDRATALANTIYGDRINTDYSLTWDKSYPWGFVKPSLAVKSLAYQLDSDNLVASADASQRFVTPQASLDAGLFFERDLDNNYLQTLEPRAFYFYSGYKNQDSLYNLAGKNSFVNFDTGDLTFNYNQLFRTTRFAGGDRLDDANQLSLGVSTAFTSKQTGVERLRMSIGQIFYARDRQVLAYDPGQIVNSSILEENTRASSNWAAQVSGQVRKGLHVNADAAYDQRADHLENANAGLHYMDDSSRIFNLTYRYARKVLNVSPLEFALIQPQSMDQLDASIVLPINSRWSIIARNNHDFTYGVELDTFAGLEYNDCCYRFRVIGRRWLRVDYTAPPQEFFKNLSNDDFEPGIMFELELKGLGSMDKQIGNLLDKTITGFSEREKKLR